MDKIFEYSDYFMIRVPFFSINHFFNNVELTINNTKAFEEAIAIASPNLYEGLFKEEIREKKIRNKEISLKKYYTRMSTRATPFGLFSGIGVGKVSDRTELELCDSTKFNKVASVDMKWLFKVIKNVEETLCKQSTSVMVQTNNMVYKLGKNYFLEEQSNLGQEDFYRSEKIEHIRLSSTKLLEYVFSLTRNPIEISLLIEKVSKYVHENDFKKIQSYIQNLLNNEFLVSSLRPPLVNSSPLDYFINQLEKHKIENDIASKLIELRKKIYTYNKMEIGSGVDIFQNIKELMKDLTYNEQLIKVDYRLAFNNPPSLNQNVANDAMLAASALWNISNQQEGLPWLKDYRLKFIEKYGLNQLVNINVVVNSTFGIGYPKGYEEQKLELENNENNNYQLSLALSTKYIESIKNKFSPVILDDNDLEDLSCHTNQDKAPNSGELYFYLYGDSNGHSYSDYAIEVSNLISSYDIGNTFGRFSNLLDDEEIEAINDDREKVNQKLNSIGILNVELSEIPSIGKNANVATTITNLNTKLNLRTVNFNESIDLEDIYVGVTLDRMFLYSKKHKKQLIFTSNNMLNYLSGSKIFRFLREVSLECYKMLAPIDIRIPIQIPVSPRIQWRNIILKPAEWILNKEDLFSKTDSMDIEMFKEYKKEYFLPRYIWINNKDNRLLVDTLDNIQLNILSQELKRHNKIIVTEDIVSAMETLKLPVHREKEQFYSEFVVPFKKINMNQSELNLLTENLNIMNPMVDMHMESDWFYIQLRVPTNIQDKFIINRIPLIIGILHKKNLIKKWFFIRYKTESGDSVLRIRVKAINKEQSDLYGHIYQLFLNWYNLLFNEGEVSGFEILPYIQEVYRYGGKYMISYIESLFEKNSEYVINLLHYKNENFDLLNSISTYWIMRKIGWDNEKIIDFTNKVIDQNKYKQIIRKYRSNAINLCKNEFEYFSLQYSDLYKSLVKQNEYLTKINELLTNCSQKDLTNSPEQIVGSLIHMHCNRVYGINIEKEGLILASINEIAKGVPYAERTYK